MLTREPLRARERTMEIREGWVAVIFIAGLTLGAMLGRISAWEGVADDCRQLARFKYDSKVYECRQVIKGE